MHRPTHARNYTPSSSVDLPPESVALRGCLLHKGRCDCSTGGQMCASMGENSSVDMAAQISVQTSCLTTSLGALGMYSGGEAVPPCLHYYCTHAI